MADAIELWGTFSVADHLRDRSYVTDALLYDRLVIPIPGDGQDGYWIERKWDPEGQKQRLDILGQLAVPMPWGQAQHKQWEEWYTPAAGRTAVAQAVAAEVQMAREVDPELPAYMLTSRILADYANQKLDDAAFTRLKTLAKRAGTRVEAVMAYGSHADLVRELGLEVPAGQGRGAPGQQVAVFDWTVHAPTAEDDDLILLERAVALAGRADFQEHRSYFYTWLRDLPDLAVGDVRAELGRRLADYERIMRGQGWHTTARRATQVLLIAPGLLSLIEPISATLAGAALGVAAYVLAEHIPAPQADERSRVAAMAHDIRAEFGAGDER